MNLTALRSAPGVSEKVCSSAVLGSPRAKWTQKMLSPAHAAGRGGIRTYTVAMRGTCQAP